MKGRVTKINQMKENVLKNDQLQYIRIAVDRFFKWTLSLDRFLKFANVPDRFFIGEIEIQEFEFEKFTKIKARKTLSIISCEFTKNFAQSHALLNDNNICTWTISIISNSEYSSRLEILIYCLDNSNQQNASTRLELGSSTPIHQLPPLCSASPYLGSRATRD